MSSIINEDPMETRLLRQRVARFLSADQETVKLLAEMSSMEIIAGVRLAFDAFHAFIGKDGAKPN